MFQAIMTKFISPGSHYGAKCRATTRTGGKKQVATISWDHELSVNENHAQAAKTLCEKLAWNGYWIGGSLPTEGNCYVRISAYLFPCFAIPDPAEPTATMSLRISKSDPA